MMELRDTVELMTSDDYKERFRAEYWQTYIRWRELYELLCNWDKGKLDFEPTCPRELLRKQFLVMDSYLSRLGERASIEHIDLNQDVQRCAGKEG